MLQERRAIYQKKPIDFFDYVLEELEREGTVLTEEICFDLMFSLLFTSYETTSTTMTLLLKFVSGHSLVLKQLTVRTLIQNHAHSPKLLLYIYHIFQLMLMTGRTRENYKAQGNC